MYFSVTGNENIIKGMKINSDYLTTETGERVQHTFEDPEYVEGLDYPDYEEDYIPGYKKCQEQCLARYVMKLVKSTQYKKLAPNALQFTFNLKSCKQHEKQNKNNFLIGPNLAIGFSYHSIKNPTILNIIGWNDENTE